MWSFFPFFLKPKEVNVCTCHNEEHRIFTDRKWTKWSHWGSKLSEKFGWLILVVPHSFKFTFYVPTTMHNFKTFLPNGQRSCINNYQLFMNLKKKKSISKAASSWTSLQHSEKQRQIKGRSNHQWRVWSGAPQTMFLCLQSASWSVQHLFTEIEPLLCTVMSSTLGDRRLNDALDSLLLLPSWEFAGEMW